MRLIAGILALLAFAPAAQAQPRALGRSDALALADGAAIVARTTPKTVTISRVPFDGSGPRTLLSIPLAANRRADVELAASAQRVGAIVTLSGRRTGYLKSAQVFTGSPDAALTSFGAPIDLAGAESGGPNAVAVAGDVVFLEDDQDRWTAIAPDGSQSPVTLPKDVSGVDFAGDLVAFGQPIHNESEEDPPTHLVLENWRTGAIVRALELPEGLIRLDLREDGRALLELDGDSYELSADGALTKLREDGSTPLAAGDRILVRRHNDQGEFDRLVVLDGSGSTLHQIGIPGRAIEDAAADAGDVIWRSHGCAFVAGIDEGPSTTFANAGCAASESYVVTQAKPPRLAHTLHVRIGCLNAADGTCRGTVRGRETVPAPYAVAAGTSGRVTLHVRARAYRRLRRERFRVVHLTAPPGFPLQLRDQPGPRG